MNKLLYSLMFFFVFSAIAFAQQEASMLSVSEMVVCTAVEERQPVGADTAFADTVGQVYCYTALGGGQDTTTIAHVWYHGDEEKARVNLNVRGSSWRTWSSKRIATEWTGAWRVDVVDAAGNVLASRNFTIR